jgi:hypothetical protein
VSIGGLANCLNSHSKIVYKFQRNIFSRDCRNFEEQNKALQPTIIIIIYCCVSGPGSSVGIATDYGLDGAGIESRWGQDFSHTSRPAMGPTQPPVQWVTGLSRG